MFIIALLNTGTPPGSALPARRYSQCAQYKA